MLTSPRACELPTGPPTSTEFVAALLHLGAQAMSSRPALATRAAGAWHELTYGELDRRSSAVAAWLLRHGVAPGDRVAVMSPPSGDWVVAFFGALRAGAVVVPFDARLTPTELAPLWCRASPTAALCAAPLAGVLDEAAAGASVPVLLLGPPGAGDPRPSTTDLGDADERVDVERAPSEPALVVFTAGTTSAPKGVTLSFANVAYVVGEAVRAHRPVTDDVWLSVLPLSHMLELACGLLPALAAGGTFCMAATLMPHELAAALDERQATRMVAVPLVLRMLRRHLEADPSGQLRSLEVVYCGGAPLAPDLAGFFAGLGIEVYQGYGLTEMSPVVCMSRPGRNRLGSVGPPLPGTEVRILGAPAAGGDGEVLARGPGLMLGYWGDEALTCAVVDADGWFHTGDVGYLDADGYLHLTGRARDLIVLESGKKVQPEDVESVLEASPLVREACVLGMPSRARHGDEVWAVVVPDDASHPDDAVEAEVGRLAATLSGYKRPARVVLHRHPLPRTPKGSLRRSEVRRLLDEPAGLAT